MEFSEDLPRFEFYFCKIYSKSPHIFSIYFHNYKKTLMNIFIEIPHAHQNRFKISSKCYNNILKFITT